MVGCHLPWRDFRPKKWKKKTADALRTGEKTRRSYLKYFTRSRLRFCVRFEPTFTRCHLVKSAFLTVLLAFSLSRLRRELNNARARVRDETAPSASGPPPTPPPLSPRCAVARPRTACALRLGTFTVIDRRGL